MEAALAAFRQHLTSEKRASEHTVRAYLNDLGEFRAHAARTQAVRRKTRSEYRLRELVSKRFMDHLERSVLAPGELGAIVDRIAAREIDPYTASNELLRRAGLKTI